MTRCIPSSSGVSVTEELVSENPSLGRKTTRSNNPKNNREKQLARHRTTQEAKGFMCFSLFIQEITVKQHPLKICKLIPVPSKTIGAVP